MVPLRLVVTAEDSADGWRWNGQLLRIGLPLQFATDTYTCRGRIVSLTLKDAAGAPARRQPS